MGTIISTRLKDDGKVLVEASLDYEEYLQLKGHLNNVYFFSDNASDVQAVISERGKNEATKYFLIPKELRNGLKFKLKTKCQKIETKAKIMFVYTLDKLGF